MQTLRISGSGLIRRRFESLVRWAHVIDGAALRVAGAVRELKEPALQLMQVIESDPDDLFIEQIIRDLTTQSLNDVATSDEVQRRFRRFSSNISKRSRRVRRKATCANAVVQFDLVDEGYEGFNKFIPYYLYPETTYSVALTRGRTARRSQWVESVGAQATHHNIAKICERYGGGGHAVVGAVSFKPEEVEEARQP
jgi:hypothetical protein